MPQDECLNLPIYVFQYKNNYDEQVFLTQNFSVTTAAYVQAQLGSNFLLGDIRIKLLVNGSVVLGMCFTLLLNIRILILVQIGKHLRNIHYLDVLVPPGTYTLSLITGDAQSSTLKNFPPCAVSPNFFSP